jgi:hypothetical protein
LSYAEHVVELANEIQRQKFHTYYSLQSDAAAFGSISMKIKQIAKQAGFLVKHESSPDEDVNSNNEDKQLFNLQFMDVYRMISSQPSFCECGKDPKEFEKFVKVMERPISTELTPIFELAPCVSTYFSAQFIPYLDFQEFQQRIPRTLHGNEQKRCADWSSILGRLPCFQERDSKYTFTRAR